MQVSVGDVICLFITTTLMFGVGAHVQTLGECNHMGRLMSLLLICALTYCIRGEADSSRTSLPSQCFRDCAVVFLYACHH